MRMGVGVPSEERGEVARTGARAGVQVGAGGCKSEREGTGGSRTETPRPWILMGLDVDEYGRGGLVGRARRSGADEGTE